MAYHAGRFATPLVFNTPEQIVALTPQNPFGRLPDGRPQVPDALIERMKLVTTEEAWSVLERRHGYFFQFEGNWLNLHPDRVVVGRAVTALFVPQRPDFQGYVEERGARRAIPAGKIPGSSIPCSRNDVLVVDLFGQIRYGTIVGDNLSTAIRSRTGTGLVVDGAIRDLQRIYQLEDFNVFARGVDPTPTRNVPLAGVNIPIRIGNATDLPGDIVLGTRSGVIFIPPHLAREVVESSENTRQRDFFGQLRVREGVYTSGEIDVSAWKPEIEADYQAWRATQR